MRLSIRSISDLRYAKNAFSILTSVILEPALEGLAFDPDDLVTLVAGGFGDAVGAGEAVI